MASRVSFGRMRSDPARSASVRECPRDLQDAVVGSDGEVHLFHGVVQVTGAFGIELAMLLHLAGAHRGICLVRLAGEAVALEFVGLHHAAADRFMPLASH